ncbi:MAG: CopG family transcriptional regulator [Bacteroidetes bacterium]|nr:CopG family transcriptional regulator [Bacteroidota bacterium]
MVTVRLPHELETELNTLVAETGRTKSFYLTEALKYYLEDMQDRFELEKAIKDFYNGNQKTFSSEELRAEFGL